MVTPEYAQTMAAYNAEMNRRVYAAAARLPDDARRAERGAFFGSIHATLSHLLWADQMWMSRFAEWDKPRVPLSESPRMVEGFEELAALRTSLDDRLLGWAAALSQDWLDGELEWLSGATGQRMRKGCGLLVAHLFNHQAHHRGQVHAMLTAAGERTGDTDLPFILG